MSSKRIQMSRQRPWRADNPDAVIVARPHEWSNPFRVGDTATVMDAQNEPKVVVISPALAVALFDSWLMTTCGPGIDEQIVRELGGRDLACWCRLDQPCHADVLLRIANQETDTP